MTACDSYQLPEHIQPHVDLITPTVHFNAIIGSQSPQDLEKRSKTPKKKTKKLTNPGQPGGGVFNGPKTTGATSLVSTDLSHCDTQVKIDIILYIHHRF